MKTLTGSRNLISLLRPLVLGLGGLGLFAFGGLPAQAQSGFPGLLPGFFPGFSQECSPPKESPTPTPTCTETVQYQFQGQVVQNREITFSAAVLKQLQGLQIESATLQLELVGPHNQSEDVSLSINGIVAARHDGSCRFSSQDPYSTKSGFQWLGMMQLDQFLLNGGVRFLDQFGRVLVNRGALVIALAPGNLKVVTATLVVTAKVSEPSCGPSPSPTPSSSPSSVPTPPAPTTSILSETPSASLTNSTTMQFTFSSDESGVTFSCSLDGAAPANCSSPQSYSGLGNGQHTFKVVSTNAFGETDPTGAQYSWTVDTTPPTVSIGTVIPSSQLTNSTTISIAFSGSASGTFSCSLDGAANSACTSPVGYSALAQGTHTVSISETDLLGNVSGTPAVYQWQVDLTPPVAQFVQVNPPNALNNSTTMAFTFAANETATFTCSLDSAAVQTCTSPFSVSQLTAGAHVFAIQPTDAAGNVGATVDYTWTADFTPPVITLGNVVPAQGLTNATNVSVEFSADKPVSFTCALDEAAAAPCVSPFTSPISTAGSHSVTIEATDMAGNVATPAVVSWTMDYTIPMISFGTILPSASSFIDSTTLTVNVNATEPVTFTSSLNGVDLNQTSSPITLTGLTEGQYTLTLNGVDGAGNASNTINYTFNVDLEAPAVTIGTTTVSGLTNQTSNSIAFSATDPDAAETVSFQCNFNNAGYTACTSPFTVSGLANGTQVLSVIGTDLAGNVSSPATFSWTVDTTPPVTSIQATQSAYPGSSITFNLTSNEANSTFVCAMDGATPAPCSSTMSYSGLSVGSHSFYADATDAVGNVDPTGATYSFQVSPPLSTKITGVNPSASTTSQTSITFTFASNVSGASFLCRFNGAAAAACTSPMTYSGLTNGSYTFAVYSSYGGTTDSTGASYSWTVDVTIPVVTAASVTTTATGATITWTTSEATTTGMAWGAGETDGTVIPQDSNYVTTHTITLTGLTANTAYSYIPEGQNLAGTAVTESKRAFKTSN
jgi:hypothetical protein